jgi:hypothetical protein
MSSLEIESTIEIDEVLDDMIKAEAQEVLEYVCDNCDRDDILKYLHEDSDEMLEYVVSANTTADVLDKIDFDKIKEYIEGSNI